MSQTRRVILPLLLLLIGSLQVFGFLFQLHRLRSFAWATLASPLPEVFSSQYGIEPMSNSYTYHFFSADGLGHSVTIGREMSPKLTRENGFLFRYGGYLAAGAWIQNLDSKLAEQILRYGFCSRVNNIVGPFAQTLEIPFSIDRFDLEIRSRKDPNIVLGNYAFTCKAQTNNIQTP